MLFLWRHARVDVYLVCVHLFVMGGCVVANLQGCGPTCFLLYVACVFVCVV